MKNRLILLIGVLVALVLLVKMFAFQVRFDEVAVLYTFDRADEASIRTAGLHFRLPPPLQKVRYFPTRLQALEGQAVQVGLADKQSIVIRTNLVWRIDPARPLVFFKRFPDFPEGDTLTRQLQQFLAVVPEIVGQYRLDQLVNADPGQLKLEEIEARALEAIGQRLAKEDYGITVVKVGLHRNVVPEEVSKKIFARMRERTETEASNLTRGGEAEARRITSEAQSISDSILAFARAMAGDIRAEGDRAAERTYAEFAQDEQFAVFLRQLEALKRMVRGKRTALFLDAGQFEPLRLFHAAATQPAKAGAGPAAGGGIAP